MEQVFTSGDSGDPVFVTVRTGLFGISESFAPLSGASLEESVIKVAFAKDTVKNGPRIDSDRGAITETQEQELYRYYGLDAGTSNEGSATGSGPDDAPAAARETLSTHNGAEAEAEAEADADADADADAVGEAAGLRTAGQWAPHPLPHGGPPPPPPHLHKHVPLPPGPHPGPHPPHRPPRPRGDPGPIQ